MEKELSDKVSSLMNRLGDMPVIDARIYKSKDGKYVINELRIKTIKPTKYYDAVIKGGYKETDADFPYGANKRGEE
jgi:hypothetical protein